MESDQRRRRGERGTWRRTNSTIYVYVVGFREPLDRLPQQVAEEEMVRNLRLDRGRLDHRLPQRLDLAFGAAPGHAARLPET